MAAKETKIFNNDSRGASVLEVVLAMAIVATATPFIYSQISRTNHDIAAVAIANDIISVRDGVLNFVRVSQSSWPDEIQIKLSDEDLSGLGENISVGFIDKYIVKGASVTDVYLAFDVSDNNLYSVQIAKKVGDDAAVVTSDKIAYGNTWAVSSDDFTPGQIIYRISKNISGEDRSKYLHRGSGTVEGLNTMERDLNMGGNSIVSAGNLVAESSKIRNLSTTFIKTTDLYSDAVYFASGANINATDVSVGTLRITGDTTGFKNIYTNTLNGNTFTTNGRIITDRATVNNSVNIAYDLTFKPTSVRNVSGFTLMSANSAYIPFLSTSELVFFEDFGITVSGELLMSTSAPLKFGKWVFPSGKAPTFTEINLSRAQIKPAPSKEEFNFMFDANWKNNGITQ